MSFLSFNFIIFIGVSFVLTWIFKGFLRKICLLGLSFYFLASFGNPIHWIYMIFIILFTYFIGYLIVKSEMEISCISGIVVIVIGLCFFKYAGFFNFDNIIMPLGLSFYSFKSISYLVDLYKKKFEAVSLLDTAVYLSFFPVVSAGPINRPTSFFEQLNNQMMFDYSTVKKGALLCALGMFQKLVFSNYLYHVLFLLESSTKELTGLYSVLYIVVYAFYIYVDFDGYSNIAIGLAQMLGFKIDRNFKTPYLASSIKEFWERWHISLSTWLRDYIYIPLGGNRKGILRKYVNIIVVFLISGFWHGSTSVFIVWGLGHGLLNVIEDIIVKKIGKGKKIENKLFKVIGILFNFVAVACLWVFFNADTIPEALQVFANVFKPMNFTLAKIGMSNREGIWLAIILIITIITDILRNKTNMIEWLSKRHVLIRWTLYIVFIVIAIIFGVYGPGYNANDFVYVTF
ncbi:MAG: MBOAT family O-acyltransferase [Erysipelotrichaceae bacterium]